MPIGNCALCGLERELRDSHLIPRKVYVYLRGAQRISTPVLITKEKMGPLSKQIHHYLLCSECELRFSENGEKCTLAHMALPKRFLLHEKLTSSKPFGRGNGFEVYNGFTALGQDDLNRLVYFGMSVFWRASISTWSVPDSDKKVRIELGPYREDFKHYLLGGLFPNKAALMISVATGGPPQSMGLMFAPQLDKKERFHNFVFYIPRIEFQLSVGNRVTAELKTIIDSRSGPNYPIYLSMLVLERAMRAARELRSKAK